MTEEELKELLNTTDASIWASEFCSTAKTLGMEIDEGWMIGWFANAIETAKSSARSQALKEAAELATNEARAMSKGTYGKIASIEEIGVRISAAIEALESK